MEEEKKEIQKAVRSDEFSVLQRKSKALYMSGYFKDATSEAQAIVKVMAGSELGLPPFASMSGIHIIQGKPTLGSNVIATLVKNDPRYDFHIKQADNVACVLEWFENGGKIGEAGFTFEEAKGAGLVGKDNWKKYTSDMLFARAISRGARRYASGIFGGSAVYTPDEMGMDVDEEGFIDVQVVDVEEEEEKKVRGTGTVGIPKFTPNDIYNAVVEAGLSENVFSAKNAFKFCKVEWNTPDKGIAWMKTYRAFRNDGLNTPDASEGANLNINNKGVK